MELHLKAVTPGQVCNEERPHAHALWIPAYIDSVDRTLQINTQRLGAEQNGGGSLAGKWNRPWLMTRYLDEPAGQTSKDHLRHRPQGLARHLLALLRGYYQA